MKENRNIKGTRHVWNGGFICKKCGIEKPRVYTNENWILKKENYIPIPPCEIHLLPKGKLKK